MSQIYKPPELFWAEVPSNSMRLALVIGLNQCVSQHLRPTHINVEQFPVGIRVQAFTLPRSALPAWIGPKVVEGS